MTDSPEETAKRRELLKELIQLEQEAGLYDEIVTPEEAVAITKQVRKEMYEAREREEAFIEGMAEAHDAVYTTLERLQRSLNDVMGVYMDMPQDIKRENPEVKELSAMHAVLNQFREMFNDNYDEVMRLHKHKTAWREEAEKLENEWSE